MKGNGVANNPNAPHPADCDCGWCHRDVEPWDNGPGVDPDPH